MTGRGYALRMVTPTSRKQQPAAKARATRRVPMTAGELLTLSDEERIRRMYDMTLEQAAAIMRKAGILTASGRLKRCYR